MSLLWIFCALCERLSWVSLSAGWKGAPCPKHAVSLGSAPEEAGRQ